MNVLLCNRLDAFSKYGGDTLQMVKTKEGLQALGIQAEIRLELQPDLTGIDLVHLFNISRVHETAMQLAWAKKHGKPVVLSPIYHDYEEFLAERHDLLGLARRCLSRHLFELLKETARTLRLPRQGPAVPGLLYPGYRRLQERVLDQADLILTTSPLEYESLENRFDLKDKKHAWACNAPNLPGAGVQELGLPEALSGIGPYVLSLSRIEPVKNQLHLARALEGTGLKLVLGGSINPNAKGYAKETLKTLDKIGGIYLGRVPEERLQAVYRGAKVFALPSWFECTGIVSLEAGLLGANLALSDRGYVRAYFEGLADFCNPAEEGSIRAAVETAWARPVNPAIQQKLTEYTWTRCAEQTRDAYQQVLLKKT